MIYIIFSITKDFEDIWHLYIQMKSIFLYDLYGYQVALDSGKDTDIKLLRLS